MVGMVFVDCWDVDVWYDVDIVIVGRFVMWYGVFVDGID